MTDQTFGIPSILLWNSQNRMRDISDNGYMSLYWYDADGNRTVKRHNGGDAFHLYLPISRTEEKDNDTAETSENNPQRNHPNTLGEGKVYFYHRDHLGSTMSVTDSLGQVAQTVEYTPTGEVFVEQRYDSICTTPYLFNGKELDEETGLYYYGARYYDPKMSVWYSTDAMQEKYPWVTTYGYCMNNPVKFKEPFGEEPVYDKRGKFLGATSEGFKGDILIYSGRNNINFGKMTRKELFEQYRDYIETLDMELSFAAGGIDKKYLPKIWTHIVSHFEGLQVYDEKFTLSSIANGRIYYNSSLKNRYMA